MRAHSRSIASYGADVDHAVAELDERATAEQTARSATSQAATPPS